MSRVTAPLLSFGASGQIAKTQVYSKWKGRPYVRRYSIPSNPKTAAQTLTRSVFAFLNNVWKFGGAELQAANNSFAEGKVLTGRNAFLQANISHLRTAADLALMIASPGSKGGLAAAAIAAANGAGQLTVTLTAPTLPSGWAIVEGIAMAIRQQDPNTGVLYTSVEQVDASSPYTPVLAGLTSGQVYAVFGWFKFTRPDGSFAYGRSLYTTGTPT